VIIIDASSTGSEPGTIFEVPAFELEALPPLEQFHSHAFRWDHALAFARWLLGDEYPEEITVFLVEAADTTFGAELSPVVAASMEVVAEFVAVVLRDVASSGERHGGS
jgi:hydrogenase maturation protease